MKPHEVNRFLSKQNPHQMRQLIDKWQNRAATDPHFRKEFPNASLYTAAQLERVEELIAAAPPANRSQMAPPGSPGCQRIYAKYCEIQAAREIAV